MSRKSSLTQLAYFVRQALTAYSLRATGRSDLDIANDILDHEVLLQVQPGFTLHDAVRGLKVKT